MIFDGSSGRKPSIEARQFVYRMAAAYILNDEYMYTREMDEFDRRRVDAAVTFIAKQLQKKANAP